MYPHEAINKLTKGSCYVWKEVNLVIKNNQRNMLKKSLPNKDVFYEIWALFTDCMADNSTDIYLFKVNNGNTKTLCGICSNLTMKRPSLLLTLNRFYLLVWCLHCWLSTRTCRVNQKKIIAKNLMKTMKTNDPQCVLSKH